MTWTAEKIKQLKKLWLKGKSTIEIGKELGISKNAVVGKVHRLELAARPSPIKRTEKAKSPNSAAKKTVKKELKPKNVTLMDLKLNKIIIIYKEYYLCFLLSPMLLLLLQWF